MGKLAWTIIVGLSVILGVFIGVFVIEDRIEKRISDKLKDPDVLKQIAQLVRPSLTFDQNGTIRANSGAGQFISNIKVEMIKDRPSKIVVSPKGPLNTPPIIWCFNYPFDISSQRINKSDWLFELYEKNYLVFEGGRKTEAWIFRLEIIR